METNLLTIGELPKHQHSTNGQYPMINYTTDGTTKWGHSTQNGAFLQEVLWSNKDNWSSSGSVAGGIVSFAASRSWSGSTSEEGSNETHNNLQPFVCIHIWKRTN